MTHPSAPVVAQAARYGAQIKSLRNDFLDIDSVRVRMAWTAFRQQFAFGTDIYNDVHDAFRVAYNYA